LGEEGKGGSGLRALGFNFKAILMGVLDENGGGWLKGREDESR
jgi:hypothetical protein